MAKRIEYKVITLSKASAFKPKRIKRTERLMRPGYMPTILEDTLNKLGEDRWTLRTMMESDGKIIIALSRGAKDGFE